ncbi:MAG: hypothetical protein IJS17_03405, partial [Clostridia bacterium]|nr:hypothetical protein [Clostridia bacterium]
MKTKILAIVLTIAVLFGVMQTAAFAADSENSIDVYFSATSDEIIVPLESLTVSDGTAEDYGYTVAEVDHNDVAVDGITVLDVLVAAHAEYYGDSFTAETASQYLAVSGGVVQKAFGKSAYASGFTINNAVPHDDVKTEYGYTGYAADTAVVEKSGSFVSFFFYQDTKYYTDNLGSFGFTEATLTPSETIELHLTGYYAAYYGCSDEETIEENTGALAEIDVFMKEANEEAFTEIGATDEDGNISITFENEGDYVLYATGETDTGCPVIYTWAIVHVEEEVI